MNTTYNPKRDTYKTTLKVLMFILSVSLISIFAVGLNIVKGASDVTVMVDGVVNYVTYGSTFTPTSYVDPLNGNGEFRGWFYENGGEYNPSIPITSTTSIVSKWYINDTIGSCSYQPSYSRYRITFKKDYGASYVISSSRNGVFYLDDNLANYEIYLNRFGSNYLDLYTSQVQTIDIFTQYKITIKGVDIDDRVAFKNDFTFWVYGGKWFDHQLSEDEMEMHKGELLSPEYAENQPTVNGGRYWIVFNEYKGNISQEGENKGYFYCGAVVDAEVDGEEKSFNLLAVKNSSGIWKYVLELYYTVLPLGQYHHVYIKKGQHHLLTVKEDIHIYSFNERVQTDPNVLHVVYGNFITKVPYEFVPDPNPQERDGYTFEGWYQDGELYDFTKKIITDVVLKAKWSLKYNTISFMVDGECIYTEQFSVETEKINEPRVPIKEGYHGKWEEYLLTPNDIVVNAIYSAKATNYQFYCEGVLIHSESILTGEEIPFPNVTKEGFTYTWNKEYVGEDSVVYEVVYTELTYKISFVVDGLVYKEEIYTYNNRKINEPSIPNKKGFSSRWEDYSLNLEDISVNAIYIEEVYKIKFIVDGETFREYTFTYNNRNIEEPLVPSKEGYDGRWEDYTLEDDNVVVNAVYKEIQEKYKKGCKSQYSISVILLIGLIVVIKYIKKNKIIENI